MWVRVPIQLPLRCRVKNVTSGKQAASSKLAIVSKGYVYRILNLVMTLIAAHQLHAPARDYWQDSRGAAATATFHKLPILAATRRAMRRQLKKTSLSFDSLAKLAERDPAICLHMLLRIAERNPESVQQISSASSCIGLLGMEEVVKLVKSLPVVDEHSGDRRLRNYVATLHSAALAGRLAASWSDHKPGLSAHQAQWAAMLASAPLWSWHIYQVEAVQMLLSRLSQGNELHKALQQSFGEQSQPHWQTLVKQLSLPDACSTLWAQHNWPNSKGWGALYRYSLTEMDGQRQLKHQCQQAEMLVYFANMLALHARMGLTSRLCRRWLTLCSHYLNHKPQQLAQQLRDEALNMARQEMMCSAVNSLLAPFAATPVFASAIHCIPDKPKAELMEMERDEPVVKEVPPAGVEDPMPMQIHQDKLNKLMKQMSQAPESFGDWHFLMRTVLKGITEDIGLSRAYIAIVNRQNNGLKVYYQEGLEATDPLSSSPISMQKPNILRKLLERPAGLMITEQNRAKMLRGIPASQQALLPQQFMMMSLFANQRPIGIMFADIGGETSQQQVAIQPSQYMAFKTLGLTTSKSLGKLAANTQKKGTNSAGSQQKRA